MKIKKLYETLCLNSALIVEKIDGSLYYFKQVPYRTITENDLIPLGDFKCSERCNKEAADYFYILYELEKIT